MTYKEANAISLILLLQKLGIEPIDMPEVGNDVWYRSPLRPQERTSNFHIDKRRNVWYDFITHSGGNTIDFIKIYNNCDEETAITFINDYFQKPKKWTYSEDISSKKELFSLKEVKPLQHPLLIAFLVDELKINQTVAKKFLVEVTFTHNQEQKEYFALALKNESEGYEIKNKYFEGFLGRKDITILRGVSPTENTVSIFTDIIDFLSAAEYYGDILTQHDVYIMHHAEFFEKMIRMIITKKYNRVYTYFSNDEAGEAYIQAVQQSFSNKHEPCQGFYYPFLNFKTFWQKTKRGK